MSLPKIEPVTGGYNYEWGEEKVRIECRRLSLRNNDLKGEITISTTAPESPANHLHQASFNFSSAQSRDRLSTMLSKRLEVGWDSILEQTCVYTMEAFRRGEKVVEIFTGSGQATPPEFLLYPFIVKNYPTIIFGDPSSSKSLFSLVVATLLALPWHDNPMGWSTPKTPVKILYCDWETDEATIGWNLACLQKGMELPPLSLNYLHCSMPLHYDIEQISEKVNECNAQITIIDSLGLAAGGDLNITEPALNFWSAWRKLKTTSLILAHTSKSSQENDKKKSVYGNVYYTAEARSIWEIKKSQEADSGEMDIALFNRKPPPFAKIHRPLGLHISFSGDGEISDSTEIRESSPQSVSEFMSSFGTQEQIKDFLLEGARTTQEIAEAISITNVNARNALKRLKDKDIIFKIGDGKWGLLSNV